MVWGEHDNRFKELNSQLLKECSQLDWTSHAGHAVSGMTDPAFESTSEAMWVDDDDVMAVTAQSSGQTLRQLAGSGQDKFARVSANPRRAAAMAASARLASATASPSSSRSASPEAARPVRPAAGPLQEEAALPATSSSAAGIEVALDPAADIANMGHQDLSTEQAEEAMRALGSLDFTQQASDMDTDSHLLVPARNLTPEHRQEQQLVGDPRSGSHTLSQKLSQESASSLHEQQQAAQGSQHMSPDDNLDSGVAAVLADEQQPPNQAQHAQRTEENLASDEAKSAAKDTHMSAAQLQAEHSTLQAAEAVQHQEHGLPQSQAAAAQEAVSQQDDYMLETDPEDPAVQRYKQAEAAIAQLRSQAGLALQVALETLLKILQVRIE